jgi:hypothetical protein
MIGRLRAALNNTVVSDINGLLHDESCRSIYKVAHLGRLQIMLKYIDSNSKCGVAGGRLLKILATGYQTRDSTLSS